MEKICNLPEQVLKNTKDIAEIKTEIVVIDGEIDDLYELLSNLPDVSGYYTKEETDALIANLQTEIDNVEVVSSKVIDDTNTNITDGINDYLYQYYVNEAVANRFNEFDRLRADGSTELHPNITNLTYADGEVRFDMTQQYNLNDFVISDLSPNKFTFLSKGKFAYYFELKQVENLSLINTNISIDTYLNGVAIEGFGALLIPDTKFAYISFSNIIDVDVNDELYFTISLPNEDNEIVIKDGFNLFHNFTISNDSVFVDKTTYETDNEIITEAVQENTNSISTLNGLISANFETFGRYQITGTSISDTDGEARFNISEVIPLDPDFITVEETPNNFVNLRSGKTTFNIIADGIINNGTDDLTLTLRIYLNTFEVDNQIKVIEAGKTVSVNYANVLPVEEDDTAYATLEITTGTGTLSTLNPVIINIDFNSTGDVSAVKSSQIIDDKATLPENGINPILNQINSLLPVGMIILSPTAPTIGSWTDMGLLQTGQTIIGGTDSNGEVISHNHQWLRNAKRKEVNGGGGANPIVSLSSYDVNESNTTIETLAGNGAVVDYSVPLFTNKTGATQNKPYGKGVGTTIHIWKRES